MACQQFGEKLLVDRYFATIQHGDLTLVVVDRNNLVSEFGKTGGGDQTDISGANNGNSQNIPQPTA